MSDSRFDFLNNEPVSGELLSERLARGPVPSGQVPRLAIDIGVALHKVHASGRVHAQLSPSCIALTQDGARILKPTGLPEDSASYRAPEQLAGEDADARSDVFAYGAMIYEIASGKRAFPGTGMELIQQILTKSPEPLGAQAPIYVAPIYAVIAKIVASCLEKDPSGRRQRVQNAVIELKLASAQPHRSEPLRHTLGDDGAPMQPVAGLDQVLAAVPSAVAEGGAAKPTAAIDTTQPAVAPYVAQGIEVSRGKAYRRRFAMIGAGVLALAATSVGAVLYLHQRPAPVAVLSLAVTQPERTSYPEMPSVSPDGRYLTFPAMGRQGNRMLWLRPLDRSQASAVPGSEGASAPFWSPDSLTIAFFAGKNLKKVRIAGGNPETICPAETAAGGGAWNRDGTILFAPGVAGGFDRVRASGGEPQQVLKLDERKFERADLWPQFLPDAKHFVFYQRTDLAETSGVYVGSLEPPEYHRLFASQTNAVYSAADPATPKSGNLLYGGYLLYINERNLTAQPFNASRRETVDDPRTVATGLGAILSMALAPISVSATGVLVYRSVGQPTRQMVWMDRGGKQITVAGEPGEWGPPRISPDGNRAAVAKLGTDGKNAHLWLLDGSGAAEQISPETGAHEGSPVWSPDGSRLAYFEKQGEVFDIFTRSALPGSKSELLVKSGVTKYPTDWSHDGKYLIFGLTGIGTRLDVWGLSMGDRRYGPILDGVYAESSGAVSPDGKWLAYQSDESGRDEVYVQRFDGLSHGTKRNWMLSKNGGLPRWRSDSSELFYMTPDGRMMSVAVRVAPDSGTAHDGGIEAGRPQSLFQTRPVPKTGNLYDAAPDGQRFLLNLPLEWTGAAPITVIANWTEKLK